MELVLVAFGLMVLAFTIACVTLIIALRRIDSTLRDIRYEADLLVRSCEAMSASLLSLIAACRQVVYAIEGRDKNNATPASAPSEL